MKKCSRCKQDFPKLNFGANKYTKDGLNYYCMTCKKEYDNEYHKLNPRKYIAGKLKPYSKTHPEKWRLYYSKKQKEYKLNPVYKLKQSISKTIIYNKAHYGFVPPSACTNCGASDKKIKGFIPKSDIEKLIKEEKKFVFKDQYKIIQWLCPQCLYKNRNIK